MEFIKKKVAQAQALARHKIPDNEEEGEDGEEDIGEYDEENLSKISAMNQEQLVHDWRKHLYDVQASRKIKNDAKQNADGVKNQ